jgi:ABC-type nitrate/sulfonate/bicarbonate transport system substrate-binding protein
LRTASIRATASIVTALVVGVGTLTGCSSEAASENGVTTLRYQGWSQQVTPPELAEALGYFDGKVKLQWVGNTISGPQEIQQTATGETDFGGAFAGAVAKLATAGAPIKAVINYYGADEKTFTGYYVLDSSSIKKPEDLVGKKIGVNTLGGQNEADIYTVLKGKGLSTEQIKSAQLVPLPPPSIEDALRKGQIDAAALTGQFQQRAVAAGGVRPVFTEPEAFGPINGGPYVFRNDFIGKNEDAVRTFTTGVAKALEWERTTPREAVIAKFTEIINARKRPNENTSTLKYWLSVGVPSKFGEISDTDFTRWEGWLRDTGGVDDKLEPSTFYTNEYNDLLTQQGKD